MLNKQELKERINQLPLFEKRTVKVKDSIEEANDAWTVQRKQGICEIGGAEAVAYVTPEYKLMQFSEVFTPVVEGIGEELEAYVVHNNGYAMVKIFPKLDELKEGDNNFGIVAINSVDCSSSVMIRFIIKKGERQFYFPAKIAGLKKSHYGNAQIITQNYISIVNSVKHLWMRIVNEFPKYKIVLNEEPGQYNIPLQYLVKELDLKPRILVKLKKEVEANKDYTLWDLFIKIVELVSDKEYKSDITRENKLDKICQKIFEYSVLMGI